MPGQSRPRARFAAFVASLALGLASIPARADQSADRTEDERQALALYEKSKAEYDLGHFAAACQLLRQAYALRPEPVLLFNLARAYEGEGNLEQALEAYARYLSAGEAASDRASIEARMATLRHQIDERESLRRQRDEEHGRAVESRRLAALAPERRPPSIAPALAVLGLGAATLGVGGILGRVANQRHAAAVDDPFRASAAEKQSQALSDARIANVLFVVGGIAAAGGSSWLAFVLFERSRTPVKVSGGVGSSGLMLSGSF
jgi:tetratricopeptide (TPR) repeat protein